jgi:hypothetical protein
MKTDPPYFSQESPFMHRKYLGAAVALLFAIGCGPTMSPVSGKVAIEEKPPANFVAAEQGQEWGSLTGKVTLDGKVPDIVDLKPKMMIHADKACCLDPKAPALAKVDSTWIVDPKTKAVQNVVVWLIPQGGAALPIHGKYKKRADHVTIDQPFCAFEPRVSAINPIFLENGKEVETGQKLIIKNSAAVSHNVRAIGNPKYNEGFNRNLPGGTEMKPAPKFNPQPLPISLQCDVHPWMAGKLFVFDHPYYAITKEDGTFTLPIVPAGVKVHIVAYHEGVGYVFNKEGEFKNGRPIEINAKANTYDFTVEAPK